jgi:RND family efflux transporter MFP subunit
MSEFKAGGYSVQKTLLISALIIILAVVFSWVIFNTEPEAKREGATKKTPMLVEIKPLEVGDYTPYIEAMGTVIPSRKIQLQSRVSGEAVEIAENFVPGRILQQNQIVIQLDPIDYQNQLQQRQSELAQSESDLQLEMGEQIAAQREYQRLGRKVNDTQKSLILREPQLANVNARVAAAKTALEQVKLDLGRTQIKSPFDAQILNTYVNLGSQVGTGDVLAEIVGVDAYWVEATLPVNLLSWLESNTNISEDRATVQFAPIKIQDRLAWEDQSFREGRLISVMGQVDGETRMARVLIEVTDPLGLKDKSLPALTLGAFVSNHIPIKKLTNVARIERKLLRKNDTLWLMQNQKLTIKSLDVIFRDSEFVYVREGVSAGDQIVTTDLSRVIEGAELRLKTEVPNEL